MGERTPIEPRAAVNAILAALSAVVVLRAEPVRAELYYTRDADGAYHFTNVPSAGAATFIAREPLGLVSDDRAKPAPPFVRSRGAGAYDPIIEEYAAAYGVEPALVKAVILGESGFHRTAVSAKGARGLMQLMPATARGQGVRDVYDARENIEAGVRYLRMLLDGYDDNLARALAAYNAGSVSVDRYHGIPPYAETHLYVARVLRFRRSYLRHERLGR